jgi:hypothetical protein
MRYIEPIVTDRTISDVRNKTSKGYFNIADWERIDNNARAAKALVDFLLSISVSYGSTITPEITTIPTVANLNTLLTNIENLRLAVDAYEIAGVVPIKNDWQAGPGQPAPDYEDANNWERNIDLIYNNIGDETGYMDWVEDSLSPVRRARTGIATTGTGLTWNNGFRRYD